MVKILVTGGTGFIGSHLVEKLVEKHEVVTAYEYHDPNSYFMKKGLDKKVVMEHVDITDFDKVMDLISRHNFDTIFHLAAQALVEVAYYNPRRTFDSNIMGTVNILEAVRLCGGVRGVIIASSDKAYGKLKSGAYTEDMPLKGDHPYDVSKSACDLIAQTYHKTYGVPVVITRFGNVYGEGDHNYSRLIPGAIKACSENKTFEVRSDGKAIRDYIHIDDVVNGYLLLMDNIEEAIGEAYNFGSKDNLTVLEVLERLDISDYEILNNTHNEIPYQKLDYKKIEKQFGWEPKRSL